VDGDIALQDLLQEVVRERGVHAPIVMQKAGSAFGYFEALHQVIVGEVFEGEPGIGGSSLSKWLELEELKYLMEGTHVGKGTHQ
jgi:hypothetical protein